MPPFLPSFLSSLFFPLFLHHFLLSTSAKVKTNSKDEGVKPQLTLESAYSPSSVCGIHKLKLANANTIQRILTRLYANMKENKSKERVKMLLVLRMFGHHIKDLKVCRTCTRKPEELKITERNLSEPKKMKLRRTCTIKPEDFRKELKKQKGILLGLKKANWRRRFRFWIVGILKTFPFEEAYEAVVSLVRAH